MSTSLLDRQEIAGLYHASQTQQRAIKKVAESSGLALLSVDFSDYPAGKRGLQRLGKDLCLPDWYGGNFDALYDCLSDPDWHANRPQLLCMQGLAEWRRRDTQTFPTLIEALSGICEDRRTTTAPLWILIDIATDEVASLPAT